MNPAAWVVIFGGASAVGDAGSSPDDMGHIWVAVSMILIYIFAFAVFMSYINAKDARRR